jgi:hypothetical protein
MNMASTAIITHCGILPSARSDSRTSNAPCTRFCARRKWVTNTQFGRYLCGVQSFCPSTKSISAICTSQRDSRASYCYREPALMHSPHVACFHLLLEADRCSCWHAALRLQVKAPFGACYGVQSSKPAHDLLLTGTSAGPVVVKDMRLGMFFIKYDLRSLVPVRLINIMDYRLTNKLQAELRNPGGQCRSGMLNGSLMFKTIILEHTCEPRGHWHHGKLTFLARLTKIPFRPILGSD